MSENLIRAAAEKAGLEVIDYNLRFTQPLQKSRRTIDHIIVHHDIWEGGTMKRIHEDHIHHRGWSGAGYHARINNDGKVELGRPYGFVGAHCKEQQMNHRSIGIVFEGDFDKKTIGEKQFEAGVKLIAEIVRIAGINPKNIKGHRVFASYKTCPGRLFPLNSLVKRITEVVSGIEEVSLWAREARLWVKSKGISDGSRPKDPVTREEIWTMIYRMAK